MDPVQFQQLMFVLDQISFSVRQPHNLSSRTRSPSPSLIDVSSESRLLNLPTPAAAIAAQHGMVVFFTSGTGPFGGSVTVQLPTGQSNTQGIGVDASTGSCAYAAWQAAVGVGLQARLESIDGVRIYGAGFSVTVVGATIVKSDF